MRVQFIRDYRGHPKGTETESLPIGVTEQLIRRGIAKQIDAPERSKMLSGRKVRTK